MDSCANLYCESRILLSICYSRVCLSMLSHALILHRYIVPNIIVLDMLRWRSYCQIYHLRAYCISHDTLILDSTPLASHSKSHPKISEASPASSPTDLKAASPLAVAYLKSRYTAYARDQMCATRTERRSTFIRSLLTRTDDTICHACPS